MRERAVFVYQLSKEDLYELAYCPENYDSKDLRNHADATDSQKSLVFSATLSVGTEFKRGYHQEATYRVMDLLSTFELEGQPITMCLWLSRLITLKVANKYFIMHQILVPSWMSLYSLKMMTIIQSQPV